MNTKPRALPFVALLATAAAAQQAAPRPSCAALDDTQRDRLARYIQAKYKLPVTMPLSVSAVEVSGNCYRKLDFQSQDSRRPFQVALYASPDFRFLSRDLLDSTLDPAIEEWRTRQEVVSTLAHALKAPQIGAKKVPVTITVFSDFQCPYCAQAARDLVNEVLPTHADTVRMEFRYFPLVMHQWARPAAEAAACARVQGDKCFWAFHDYLFEHQRDLNQGNLRQNILDFAVGLDDFDVKAFTACMEQKSGAPAVDYDIGLAKKLSITGTPTIFINGERVGGYRPDQVRSLVEKALREKSFPIDTAQK